MQSNTWQHTITAVIAGTSIGIYKAVHAAPFMQSLLLTIISSAVSCIVTFLLQRVFKNTKP